MFAGVHFSELGGEHSSNHSREIIKATAETTPVVEPRAKVFRQPSGLSGAGRVPVTQFGNNQSSVR